MLYQPFSKEELLLKPDFSSGRYAEGPLTIKPNPIINALTYCVSNRDLNSLMKSGSGGKIKPSALANSKKTKQSIKKVATNSHPGGVHEKVRKSVAQSKQSAQ